MRRIYYLEKNLKHLKNYNASPIVLATEVGRYSRLLRDKYSPFDCPMCLFKLSMLKSFFMDPKRLPQ